MIQVYTPFSPLINRLEKIFDNLDIKNSIMDINEKHIVIAEARSALKILSENPKVKVFVLSDVPSFAEGQLLLYKGAKGYANTYIHLAHLSNAIQIINNGNIWVYPSFMTELVSHSMPDIDAKDDILNKLTLREQETALQIAKGMTNKEVAIELGITERTVKAHMSSIFKKTEINGRFTLALILSKRT